MTSASACSQKARIRQLLQQLEADPGRLQANWCVPPQEGKLLYLLASLLQAKQILEVGTSIGYSTLWLGLCVTETGGQIETIDASVERLSQATNHFEAAGLENIVQPHLGDACSILQTLLDQGRRYDLMFIDARKSEYREYLRFAESLVSSGGLLVADNTQSHRNQMLDFLEVVSTSPLWDVTELETENGILIGRRQG
jgi:predicted O-methyltransferase YrrM